jgi:hypothetical protein
MEKRMNNAQAYVEGLSNEVLFEEWRNQYLSWTKTGVLEDGVIRTLETKLNAMDESLHIHQAEQMFKDECTKRFARMMATVNQGVIKYAGTIETLKENQSAKVPGDTYDYETDIKNTKEFVRDLKKIRK